MLDFQLRFGPIRDPDSLYEGRELVWHHIEAGHFDCVQYLLTHGCNSRLYTRDQLNLEQYANVCGHPRVAQVVAKCRDAELEAECKG
jgi:hypothetical protein